MNTMRLKIQQPISFILFFAIIITIIPINALSFQIKSTKITKVGEINYDCRHGGCATTKPIMVRVIYSCDNDNESLSVDLETTLYKNKWGEWLMNEHPIKYRVGKQCEQQNQKAFDLNDNGLRSSEQGNFNEAIAYYSKAITLSPRDGGIYYNRGHAYNQLGEYKAAITDFSKAIELKPKYVDAYAMRGKVYRSLGKHNQAITDLNKAIELNPNDAFAYNELGRIHNSLGKHEEAITDLIKQLN